MAEALPVDVFHWAVASIPILILLVLLVRYRWSAHTAAVISMLGASAIALTVFQAPLFAYAVAVGKGVWDAIFVLYVVWPALLMYLVTERAGALYALRVEIQQFSSNDLFLVLAFGWVFVSFLQGIAGFGAPIAIVAPLLLALGVRPVYAVAIPLIGHAWNNNFGTLAVGWFAADSVAPFEAPVETALQTGIIHIAPIIAGGIAIAWLYGRWEGVRHGLPMILVITAAQWIGLMTVAVYSPFLSGFLAGTVALAVLYPLSRWERYDQQHEPFERPAMEESMSRDVATDGGEPTEEEDEPDPIMGLVEAFLPYGVLLAIALVVALPPVDTVLAQFEIGFPFPAIETGYLEQEAADPYEPFAILTHPGSVILVGVIFGYGLFRSRGYYSEWRDVMETSPHVEEEGTILDGLKENGVPASLSIILLIIMAIVMVETGQITVLALGIAAVLPPTAYLFVSNGIGVLGAFITGSNTASNIMFSPLQDETAAELDLPQWSVLASQMTGGAVGNAISPSNIVLGTGTVGIPGEEGDVLRLTLPWVAIVIVLVGILTVLVSGFVFLGGGG
ncbi:L-lactate permease [Natrialba magadii ATCC 43099]|uniref:L-lactate permease n=1 Tax=Natrialba magadii (strain ATCC 43099 / DSM 3394 / CCM 3739 / CIP 104546 / IAM 13178 / JCM 8861 / NBRC 102185 / NCIMB 2190 / MS3) TaxID=547559 RepID=D3SR23_NATMM|nr:L-lactate permease [Natrialba magadii]ADD06579.1 L-lactate permease [Natrialba magadii ATCC 43099]ELY31960.1 L-lactate permease [Natrialba magadii ATCC 43099]